MINIAVILPTTINKVGAKSLDDLEEFYRSVQNDEAANIIKAAKTCEARAYSVKRRSRDIVSKGAKKTLYHVTFALDFDNTTDAIRFMNLYTMIVK